MENLYSGKEYFLLSFGNSEMYIDEPVDWDKINISTDRDKDFYGFNSNYIGEDVKLTFPKHSGGDFICSILDQYGTEANIYFEFGLTNASGNTSLYNGKLALSADYNRAKGDCSCSIERTDFEGKIRAKFGTKISLSDTKDLDQETITVPTPKEIQLHSKQVLKTAEENNADILSDYHSWDSVVSARLDNTGPFLTVWMQPDSNSVAQSDLESIINYPMGITVTDPYTRGAYIYQAKEGGLLSLDFAFYGEFSSVDVTAVDLYVWQDRNGVQINQQIYSVPFTVALNTKIGWQFPKDPGAPMDGSGSLTIKNYIEPNDKIFIGIKITMSSATPLYYECLNYSNWIILNQNTIAPRTTAKCYKVFDVLNQLVYGITGLNNRVISSFFDAGGAGENFVLSNGFAIRGFDYTDKPFQIDLQTILQSLQSIFAIGCGYKNVGGVEYLVIEPFLYFFGKNVIAIIEDTTEYSEAPARDFIYNELSIGYDQFAENNSSTSDEFATEIDLLFPINNTVKKLTQKSKLIASGYLIEQIRREQFKTNPSASLSNDDNVFIIASEAQNKYTGISYSPFPADDTIYFSVDLGLIAGDIVTLKNNTYNNNVAFTIIAPTTDPWGYKVSPTPSSVTGGTETTDADITAPGGGVLVVERNNHFQDVQGTVSPGTIYNARISPKRMAYNWGPMMNIGSIYVDDAKIIKTTFAKSNNAFQTQFKASEPFPGYTGTDVIKEKADIVLSDYSNREVPFLPVLPNFKAQISYEIADTIRKALFGEMGDPGKDYGCIVAPDDNEVLWKMAVLKIDYNPYKETMSLQCAKIEPY